MAKLKLVANPTFKAKVGIPVAGSDPVDMEFTFKHRTKAALDEFKKSSIGKSDAESLMDIIGGWDFEEEFTAENVASMMQNYQGSALAIYRVYCDQLEQVKLKN